MIKIVKGNILDASEDIIVQQVNCKGVMGAGLAKAILNKYPNVKKEYQSFRNFNLNKGLTEKDLLGLVNYVRVSDGKVIANVFGQVNIKKNHFDKTVYTKTEALTRGLKEVKELSKQLNKSVAIPYGIGCGLAGGDWNIISELIDSIFSDYNVAIYKLD
ncbi:Appr-1-p processing protein [Bacillus inaquosorum]|uniref:Appr-1-p processing protein n=1 Tax=Bacillus inaquosorum TaxID=483913 RepID=UPI00227E9A55|nr:Appr-1-p processing protein [Bacillus inaquosorum]MCY8083233.1 Appr-1-p processing protein [Bacillus inaquosorum]MCY8175869.1 Appr-1-p processing protein [Bacillus inaquosorum]